MPDRKKIVRICSIIFSVVIILTVIFSVLYLCLPIKKSFDGSKHTAYAAQTSNIFGQMTSQSNIPGTESSFDYATPVPYPSDAYGSSDLSLFMQNNFGAQLPMVGYHYFYFDWSAIFDNQANLQNIFSFFFEPDESMFRSSPGSDSSLTDLRYPIYGWPYVIYPFASSGCDVGIFPLYAFDYRTDNQLSYALYQCSPCWDISSNSYSYFVSTKSFSYEFTGQDFDFSLRDIILCLPDYNSGIADSLYNSNFTTVSVEFDTNYKFVCNCILTNKNMLKNSINL